MAESNRQLSLKILRRIYEGFFSLSIGFLLVSIIFLLAPGLSIPFAHLEVSIKDLLHLKQTDLIRGYFEYAISTILLALCIGVLLLISSRTRITNLILRSASGIVLLLAPPIFWVCYYQTLGWPFGWPYRWAPVELVIAICCMILYMLGKWPIPGWVGILLLGIHYSFWYWIPSSNPNRADYAGPIAPILVFCSAWVWAVYAARLRDQVPNVA